MSYKSAVYKRRVDVVMIKVVIWHKQGGDNVSYLSFEGN